MYTLLTPSHAALARFAAASQEKPLSTPRDPLKEEPHHHWDHDRYEVPIVIPEEVTAARVRQAVGDILLRELCFFPRWMLTLRRGDIVVVGAQLLGIWGIFADRIIASREDYDDASGFFDIGFTYATVQGHFETGIESFRASRMGRDSPVLFQIEAVSRPSDPLRWLISRAFVRDLQRKFGADTTNRFRHELTSRFF